MLLVIDIGNTNIVLGVYEQDSLNHHWRMHTNREATEDEYAMMIQNLFAHAGISDQAMKGVIISSVVPPLTRVFEKWAQKYLSITAMVIGPGVKTGINILYDPPRDVGADRIVNAVAGVKKYGYPLIIVDFGTATTFCCVDEKGNYRGGVISPGIHVSSEALVSRAAKLTRVEFAKPEQIVGRNTTEAIQAGLYYGYVEMVDGIVRRMKEELTQPAKVVATGGLARLIAEDAKSFDIIEPWLTLEGLKLIYERNQEEAIR
jgi:type III pantothenate kinase